MASSLDQIGPITKTVEDAAILFEAIKGKDELDATSIDLRPTTYNLRLEEIRKLKIGLPKEYFTGGLSKEVEKAIEEAIKNLKSLKIEFKEISLPHTKYALSCYYIIMPAEVSANLARFDGIRYSRTHADNTQTNAEEFPRKSALSPRRSALGKFISDKGARIRRRSETENYFRNLCFISGGITTRIIQSSKSGGWLKKILTRRLIRQLMRWMLF